MTRAVSHRRNKRQCRAHQRRHYVEINSVALCADLINDVTMADTGKFIIAHKRMTENDDSLLAVASASVLYSTAQIVKISFRCRCRSAIPIRDA